MRRTAGCLCTTIATALAFALPSAGATPPGQSSPHGAVRVTRGPSGYRSDFTVVSGTPKDLIYYVTGRAVSGTNLAVASMYARTKSGKTKPIKGIPDDALSDSHASVVGNLITTEPNADPDTVYWANIATGSSGSKVVPDGDTYVGTSNDGWLLSDVSGDLYDQAATGGGPKSLGTPIGFTQVTQSIGNSGGVVLGSRSFKLVYMSWARPGHFVSLNPSAAGTQLDCTSLVGDAVGCAGDDSNTGDPAVFRFPINGGTGVESVTSVDDNCPMDVALTAKTTAWADCDTEALYSTAAAGGTKASTKDHLTDELTAAYGDLAYGQITVAGTVEVVGETGLIKQTTSATAKPTTIGTAPYAPIGADKVELTPAGVALETNAAGKQLVELTETISGKTLRVGKPTPTLDDAAPYSLSSSDETTAAVEVLKSGYSTKVRSPLGTYTFKHAGAGDFWGDPQVSGNRALYQTLSNNKGFTTNLLDLVTGKSTAIVAPYGAALSGNTLAYVKPDGSVWARELASGKPDVELRQPVAASDLPNLSASVFASGEMVGWGINVGGPYDTSWGYVDLRHPSKPTTFSEPTSLIGLSDDGAIEIKTSTVGSNDGHYYLQQYGSIKVRRLAGVPINPAPGSVSVAGGRLGWIDDQEQAYVAPLPGPHIATRPADLGNDATPTDLVRSGKSSWRAVIPFSETLTKCSFSITRGKKTIASLPCRRTSASDGDAIATWPGTDSRGHKVANGRYRWTLHAANPDGKAVSSDGRSHRFAGTITVS